MALDNTVEVETPEHVHFRYRVAGPVRRMLAYAIDFVIRALVLVFLGVLVSIAMQGSQAVLGVILVLAFILEWGYYVFFETIWSGRTLGKRALSLRVVKEGGYPIGVIDSILRNLLRGADILPLFYVIGLFVMGGDSRFRRIGDRVAGTLVVVEERSRVAAALTITPTPTATELEGFPQRPPLSAWERETLELFLRRSDLTPARREELAQMIAPALAQRMGVTMRNPVRFLALLHHRIAASARPRA
ncbi:MAG TPA: RDD family protein [Polyangia bacterium]|nr:RDD family protein [Polyangia bacterium]